MQSEINTIPLNEYISGKSLFNALPNVWKCTNLGDYNNVKYPPDIHPIIMYCHTDVVNTIFSQLKQYTNSFILISHNSDGKVTYNPKSISDANINLMPSNLFCWFCQNLMEKHSNLHALPIGLENDYWSSENKQLQIYNKVREDKKIKNLCYLNANIDTNPNERGHLYNELKNKEWVTKQYGKNGQNFTTYIDNIRNHHFVLCPEGNQNGHNGGYGAMGSHRVWETLYVGSIPIVKKSVQTDNFNDLPILCINDWNDLSEEYLQNELKIFNNTKYNIEKLFLSYWINKINQSISIFTEN